MVLLPHITSDLMSGQQGSRSAEALEEQRHLAPTEASLV
jgi:hypothetical protein